MPRSVSRYEADAYNAFFFFFSLLIVGFSYLHFFSGLTANPAPALSHGAEPSCSLTCQGESELAQHASRCDCSNRQDKQGEQAQSGGAEGGPCGDSAKEAVRCWAI